MSGNPFYSDRYHYFSPGRLTPAVKMLLLINGGSYLISSLIGPRLFFGVFGLNAPAVFSQFKIYQLVTYLFVHAGVLHLLFNMLILWIFGRELESLWGTPYFIKYYFVAGIGAGFCSLPFIWGRGIAVVGASGAIFGLLIAFAVIFPERVVTLLLFFVLPLQMKAKHLALLFCGLEIIFLISRGGGEGTAHFAHLGGGLVGWIYLKWGTIFPRLIPKRFFSKPPPDDRSVLREKINRLLDKLSREGWEGLTSEEKEELKDAGGRL